MAAGVDESPEIATSLPLGAARLTKDFLKGDPYTDKSLRTLRDHIENKLEQILPSLVKHQESDRAIATSKTLRTLARLAGDWFDGTGNNITVEAVRKITAKLSEMDENTRAKLPGVSENRASQIVAGSLVAESVMRNLDIKELEICPWALREGVVLKWMDWMEA
jgi:exopolyphosphatase/guanosine-5'-triphosphate,3'-diphosphate pyrophosphatase